MFDEQYAALLDDQENELLRRDSERFETEHEQAELAYNAQVSAIQKRMEQTILDNII